MARKEQLISIRADGRDKGKVFKITEMSAEQAERWAIRAFLALARSGMSLPDGLESSGMAGIAALSLKVFGHLQFTEAEVLMAEMFRCLSYIPTPDRPDITRALMEGDIEEVPTRIRLRAEVLSLHTGFSLADVLSILTSLRTSATSSTTQTSQEPSEPLSPQEKLASQS